MNNVSIIGRLTKDIELRYTPQQTAVAQFSIAINRGKDKNGDDKGVDFPRIIVFGKMAENCERYLKKGRLVGIQGRIQTGSYKNKNGDTVYTTDVVANNVEFLGYSKDGENGKEKADRQEEIPEGFQALDDKECPF